MNAVRDFPGRGERVVVPMTSSCAAQLARFAGSSPIGRSEDRRLGSQDEPQAEPLVEDLLVEEVSIDGMCGVY
jgi:mycofactocin precursor